jgi:GntR family transcriptional regulator
VTHEVLLDRGSAVPLYYQLQELLRQQIESGVWGPGDPLPSEPALCRLHSLSRGCVRQALSILEADRAIVRRRGRGTFVAPTRLSCGVPGLVRVLQGPDRRARSADAAAAGDGAGERWERPDIHVLDRREGVAEESVCRLLGLPAEKILRLTTRWSSVGVAYAIGVSFLDAEAVPWLGSAAVPGQDIAVGKRVGSDGPAMQSAEVSIETTECGRYEADQLGVVARSTLMVTVSVHSAAIGGVERPIEVTRLGYVGDRVQLRFRGEPVRDARPARWDFGP